MTTPAIYAKHPLASMGPGTLCRSEVGGCRRASASPGDKRVHVVLAFLGRISACYDPRLGRLEPLHPVTGLFATFGDTRDFHEHQCGATSRTGHSVMQ